MTEGHGGPGDPRDDAIPPSAIRRLAGAVFIVGGIGVNPWTVSAFSPTGPIGSVRMFCALLLVEAAAVAIGILLLSTARQRGRALALWWVVVWAVFWLGWVFSRSEGPVIGWYSRAYVVFLVASFVPLLAPLAYGAVRRQLGPRAARLAITPLVLLVGLTYVVGGEWYYATRQYLFDPYLQNYPPRLAAEAGSELGVLALGGSTTENRPMLPADRYPARLESILSVGRPGGVVVLNGGRSFFTTRHTVRTYAQEYHELDAEVVVVMHAINDLVRSCAPRSTR